jgi:hypothetical protein
MERRQHVRRSIQAAIYITLPGTDTRRCVARNMSRGGVFIEPPGPPALPGAIVNLAFTVHHSKQLIRLYQRRAVVVRSSAAGVALRLQPAQVRSVQPTVVHRRPGT